MVESKPRPMTDTRRMRKVIDHGPRRNLRFGDEFGFNGGDDALMSWSMEFVLGAATAGVAATTKGDSAEPFRSRATLQLTLVERLLRADDGESGESARGRGRSLDVAASSRGSGGLSWSTVDPSASLEDADGRPFMGEKAPNGRSLLRAVEEGCEKGGGDALMTRARAGWEGRREKKGRGEERIVAE